MKWAKISDHCIISETGYKVAKYCVDGESKYRASNPSGEFVSGFVKSAEEAKKACK